MDMAERRQCCSGVLTCVRIMLEKGHASRRGGLGEGGGASAHFRQVWTGREEHAHLPLGGRAPTPADTAFEQQLLQATAGDSHPIKHLSPNEIPATMLTTMGGRHHE